MNILYLSLGDFEDLSSGSVHIDLMKRFNEEHNIYLVCKRERRYSKATEMTDYNGLKVLRVKTGNIKRTNLIEKGISTLTLENQFLNAIKKYYRGIKFDAVIYTTPPITFEKIVNYVKKRDGAKSYLMLKDIFPQNALDIGILSNRGLKGLVYLFFRNKEKRLYSASDYIGCMSSRNVEYLLKHNPEVDKKNVDICPNSIFIKDMSADNVKRNRVREKYGLPKNKRIFVYGGNLGKPQGIPFLIECLKDIDKKCNSYFLIVGKGTEYVSLVRALKNQKNARIMESLPKNDFDVLVGACDIGMIFLDYRFTIPNFPSRLLSYMQAKLPVLVCTDRSTDIGKIVVEGGFGWACKSNDVNAFVRCVSMAERANLSTMKDLEWEFLKNNYSVDTAYKTIMNRIGR